MKKTSSGQTTRWIGGDYEIAHSGTVTKYLAGGKQVGTSFFALHSDHLGSIQGVTDATGTEVRRQDHKPFGDQHFVSGSHQESKGWIGEREEETELVYLNARYYDPEIGRFISPDPILRFGQGLNRYSYSWNNPISVSDPSGMDPPGDPCAGMSVEQCANFLNGHPQETFKGNCEVNPYCDPNGSPFDFEGEQMNTNRIARMEMCLTYGICDNIPDYDETMNDGEATDASPPTQGTEEPNTDDGPQPDNPLYNCSNGLKTNCPGNRSGGGNASPEVSVASSVWDWVVEAVDSMGIVAVASGNFGGFAVLGGAGSVDGVWIPGEGGQLYDSGGAGGGLGDLYGLHGGVSFEPGIGFNIHERKHYLGDFHVLQFSGPNVSISLSFASRNLYRDPWTITMGPSAGTMGISYSQQGYNYFPPAFLAPFVSGNQ